MSCKKGVLKISQNPQENILHCNFIKKETLAQVFPCEFYEIFKNTFFYRIPPVATSGELILLKYIARALTLKIFGAIYFKMVYISKTNC